MIPFWCHGVLMAFLHALDIATTRIALSLGAKEANPLMVRAVASLWRMLAIKSLAVAFILGICFWLYGVSPDSAIPLLWLQHGIVLGVVVGNLMVIHSKRREKMEDGEK